MAVKTKVENGKIGEMAGNAKNQCFVSSYCGILGNYFHVNNFYLNCVCKALFSFQLAQQICR